MRVPGLNALVLRSSLALTSLLFTAPFTLLRPHTFDVQRPSSRVQSSSSIPSVCFGGVRCFSSSPRVEGDPSLSPSSSAPIFPLKSLPHNSCEILVPPMLTDESALALSPSSSSAFLASLQSTVSHCAAAGKTALWLHLLGPSSAPLLPLAFAAGFTFHHADGHNASLALWLPSLPAHPAHGLASKIPDYATHQVGVGALVYHAPTASVLCVREVGRNYSKWKLPGGLLDARESLDAAACREVGEETGVKADYGGLLGFRHSVGGGQFGRSDLYYVCWMTPSEVCEKRDEKGRPMPSAQEGEITDTEWVPFKELYDMYGENGGSPHPMLRKVLDIAKDVLPGNKTIGVELEGDGGKGRDIQRTLLKSVVPGRKPMPFYHVEQTKKA